MYKHLLHTLKGEEVYVNTDSPQIASEIGEDPELGHVTAYMRESKWIEMEENSYASPVLGMIEEFIERYASPNDVIMTPHCTSPFLRMSTMRKALEHFDKSDLTSLSSVTVHKTFACDSEGTPINFKQEIVQRTQDLPPVLLQNSALFLFKADAFLKKKHRITDKHEYYPIGFPDDIDIDYP